jgi:chromatin structure-remodeling complex subunit RSC1/2
VRSRKYASVEQFINDLDLMFANAQLYYQDDPYGEEFLDYLQFKKEAHIIIQAELNKSDKEILLSTSSSSDGILRYPLESLEIDGYTYKIGNWVLMKNPADPERPIVGQIFRMWSTEDGKKYCNMCWYYRPEQTCHAVDRLFFMNEVCKTGQYRDHLVDDIIGPCYVIFLTRYKKGDLPEGVIPESAPWFICEFRYNENSHHFNRIRTWKACLPDEVRDDPEQPLVPLPETRKLIKYDSPIKDMLPPNAYQGMDIPDPIPGTANSPPLSGSVFIDAPLPNDDLGQYISSQNVVAVPEHDDPKSTRHAYLFTPISQLKGGGGSTNTVYATTPALPHGTPSHVPAKPISDTLGLAASRIAASTGSALGHPGSNNNNANVNNILPREADKPQFPGTYKLLHEQIQENQAKKQQEQQLQQLQHQQHQQLFRKTTTPTPTSIVPTGTTYHSSTSSYSNLINGGTLAYGLEDDDDSLGELSDLVNKKRKVGPNGETSEEILFYRAPPIQLGGNRIVTNSNLELGHSASYLAWKLNQEK